MVLMAFPEKKSPSRAINLIKEVYRFTDEMIAGCTQKSGARLPCKKGCFWCCFLRVRVTPLEVMCIVDDLRSRLKPEEIFSLRQRIIRTDEITRGMIGYQRVRAKMMCPLLVEGECTSYPLRPIECRVYHSLSSLDCEALLVKVDASVAVRHDIFGLSTGILTGLAEGLQSVGLSTRQLELIAGLRILLDDSGSRLGERWLSGKPAFAGAEIAIAGEQVHLTGET
jgi:Fe-S-cluster containining protein